MEAILIVALEKIRKEPHESIGDYVYNTLKKNIINMNIKPGDKISEKEISGLLELSRTPIREAFIKLSREGVLYILPQKGTYISKINLKQVDEARFIRECLEKGVMAIAVKGIPEAYQTKLEKSLKKQKNHIDKKEYEKFLEEDEAFHRLIFEACDKERSWEIIEMVNTQYKRVRLLSFELNESLDKVYKQHVQIYDTIVNKNLSLAEEMVTIHVKKILTDQMLLQQKFPEYFETDENL